jgi:hypothetical protein
MTYEKLISFSIINVHKIRTFVGVKMGVKNDNKKKHKF